VVSAEKRPPGVCRQTVKKLRIAAWESVWIIAENISKKPAPEAIFAAGAIF